MPSFESAPATSLSLNERWPPAICDFTFNWFVTLIPCLLPFVLTTGAATKLERDALMERHDMMFKNRTSYMASIVAF